MWAFYKIFKKKCHKTKKEKKKAASASLQLHPVTFLGTR